MNFKALITLTLATIMIGTVFTILHSHNSKKYFRFKGRISAGILLADRLSKYKDIWNKDIVVFGIPRGGVVVADIVATKLNSNYLEIIISRKLGAPHNKEIAIGAITEDDSTFVINSLINSLGVSHQYFEKEKFEQKAEIERKINLYRNTSAIDFRTVKGKTVILVDDGIASGATMIIAARWLRKYLHPKHLIIAAPIAPKDVIHLLEKEADSVVVVATPTEFSSVAEYFEDFSPIKDEKVIEIIRQRTEDQ